MYFEYKGGLGDVIMRAYRGQYFRKLNRAQKGDKLAVISHNPYCIELFQNHPKFPLLEVLRPPYWDPEEGDEAKRAEYGLPPPEPMPDVSDGDGMDFYPFPFDKQPLAELLVPGRPAVAVCQSAGLPFRDIPLDLTERLIGLVLECGGTPVLLGRSYDRYDRRECMPGYKRDGVVNLIDKLSVPGSCLAVQRSVAVVTCHSSMNAIAWQERKPQLLLYPDWTRHRHFLKRDQWSFGMYYPETFQATLEHGYGVEVAIDNFFSYLKQAFGKVPDLPPTIPYPPEAQSTPLTYSGGRLTPERDVRLLIHTLAQYPGDIIEVGCSRGQTTLDLAVAFPGRRIWAIHCPWEPVVAQQEGERIPGDWVCDQARHLPNVVPVVKPFHQCPPEMFSGSGSVFIDGDHSYYGCSRDTAAALAALNGKGLIAWHDCYDNAPEWVGVGRVVAERYAAGCKVWRPADSWTAFEEVSP